MMAKVKVVFQVWDDRTKLIDVSEEIEVSPIRLAGQVTRWQAIATIDKEAGDDHLVGVGYRPVKAITSWLDEKVTAKVRSCLQ